MPNFLLSFHLAYDASTRTVACYHTQLRALGANYCLGLHGREINDFLHIYASILHLIVVAHILTERSRPSNTLIGVNSLGLTKSEAETRLVSDGPNVLPSAKPRNLLQRFIDVVREPMLTLLVAAGLINFIVSEPLDAAVLMLTVFIVVGISLYQSSRTEKALEALRDLSSRRALVVRDGIEARIPGRDVVRGDLVILSEGDRVPADGGLQLRADW